jgi:AraC-like DNA-binding protein
MAESAAGLVGREPVAARRLPGGVECPPAAAPARVPPGHVRVSSLQWLPALLREFGVKPENVLRGLSLDERVLSEPDRAVPIVVRGELLARTARACDCDYVGLLLGGRSGSEDLGTLGCLVRRSATVGEALDTLQRLWWLHNPTALVFVRQRGPMAALGYSLMDGSLPGMAQWHDQTMALMLRLMREMLGPRWVPSELRLMRRTPAQAAVYAEHFGCRCRFDAPYSEMLFPRALLDCAPGVDFCASPGREATVTLDEAELPAPEWLVLAHRAAFVLLLQGECCERRLAEMMALSVRTLVRRLAEAGGSYQLLLEHARFAASRMLLRETAMPVREVALTLGYVEPSSFTRAFCRWSGVSPVVWRRQKVAAVFSQ